MQLFCMCQLKTLQNLNVESYILLIRQNGGLSRGHSNSNSSEKLFQRGKGGGGELGSGREEVRIHRSFCNKDQIVKTPKDYC